MRQYRPLPTFKDIERQKSRKALAYKSRLKNNPANFLVIFTLTGATVTYQPFEHTQADNVRTFKNLGGVLLIRL